MPVRQNAADKKPSQLNDAGTPSTAAEIRALAEQAEAEAAEAEALAAAARARARAIQLRRQAELVDAEADVTETEDGAQSAVEGTEPETEQPDVGIEGVRTEEGTDDAVAQAPADHPTEVVSDLPADRPAWYRRWRRRPKLKIVAASLAVICIAALLAASAYMVWEHRNASRQQRRVAEFAAAARQGVVTLTSLDFNNAKEGVQRILDDSTGAFKDDFQKMANDFTKVVEESKVIEQGTVQAVAVDLDSVTDDSAVALVASKSEVTNAAGAKQDPRSFRLIVTLSRDGGQLKMSKVEFVP